MHSTIEYKAIITKACQLLPKMDRYTFRDMFSLSHLPQDYFYNKWYNKVVSERDFPAVYLNMDYTHQCMVADYLKRQAPNSEPKNSADILNCWFLFCYNFPGNFWKDVFGEEDAQKYIKLCGKSRKGLIPYIGAPQICKLFLKLTEEQKDTVIDFAFTKYEDNIDRILDLPLQRITTQRVREMFKNQRHRHPKSLPTNI